MSLNLKRSASWKQLLIFLGLAIGLFFILSIAGAAILGAVTGVSMMDIADPSKWDYANPKLINVILGLQLIQFLSLFLIPSLLFGYLSDPHPLPYLGFKKPNNSLYYLFGIALMIVSYPLIAELGI